MPRSLALACSRHIRRAGNASRPLRCLHPWRSESLGLVSVRFSVACPPLDDWSACFILNIYVNECSDCHLQRSAWSIYEPLHDMVVRKYTIFLFNIFPLDLSPLPRHLITWTKVCSASNSLFDADTDLPSNNTCCCSSRRHRRCSRLCQRQMAHCARSRGHICRAKGWIRDQSRWYFPIYIHPWIQVTY